MCNAWNHSADCDCGFGGDTGAGGWSTLRDSWAYRDEDFCRSTTCPQCGNQVYFVRHNGGSVWFDDLGPPWPKHSCFDDDISGRTLRMRLTDAQSSGRAPVFGVVLETTRPVGSDSGIIWTRRSDGQTLIQSVPNARIPAGQLVIVDDDGIMTPVPPISTAADARSVPTWKCPLCSFVNPVDHARCAQCDGAKPHTQGSPPPEP